MSNEQKSNLSEMRGRSHFAQIAWKRRIEVNMTEGRLVHVHGNYGVEDNWTDQWDVSSIGNETDVLDWSTNTGLPELRRTVHSGESANIESGVAQWWSSVTSECDGILLHRRRLVWIILTWKWVPDAGSMVLSQDWWRAWSESWRRRHINEFLGKSPRRCDEWGWSTQ